MPLPERHAPGSLEHAATQLREGMGAARRGRDSLPELRENERGILREWARSQNRLFQQDPTLTLGRRQSHGEHTVAFDPDGACWWKVTHPGKTGVGAEFHYEDLPPFEITGISARELLPSEYVARLLLHNEEFGDDIRLEGYLDADPPSLVISQPDISGSPATKDEMECQMASLGYLPLHGIQLGKNGSISFYHPERRIALFDAHPGNFFNTGRLTLPVDGILLKVSSDAEHRWLGSRTSDSPPDIIP